MKYRVLGHSRENGRRMSLELDAKSKADAERQATRQNLNIIRIEPLDHAAEATQQAQQTRPSPSKRAGKGGLWLLIMIAAVVVAIWGFWRMHWWALVWP